MSFMETQAASHYGKALDFVGTWALTRFVRAKIKDLRGSLLILPPHYFLSDPKKEFPSYCVSLHPGENSWGDKTKKRWWDV